ncbi:putative Immunoglobulin I-set domain protein [Verrucomicrobia bacterium]|nr:putative Immunoglobulin I-set domain protein [Verrucomicrobiota bacterium]
MNARTTKSHLAAAPIVAVALTLSASSGLGGLTPPSDIYPAVVKSDGALGYYRFNDSLARSDINLNSGSLGAAGNATNDLEFVFGGSLHSMPGAIVGDPDRAEFFDYTTRTEIPFNAAINTTNTQPFTLEAWLYPVSDQANTGMGVLCNRYTQGADPSIGLLGRQGWVMYQRGANTNTSGYTQGPGVGWEFRMYNGQDGSGHIDVTSGVPFTLGQWQHVVVVYDPVDSTATNATASIFINGVLAAVNTNTLTIPGYAPCTGNHDPTIAVNGQPAMSLGGYNNANGGTYGFENPWIGGIDEFAWYPVKLSAAKILAHFQNGTNANRSVSYTTLIKSDNPTAYLRLDEVAPGPNEAVNIGDLRSAGDATNSVAIKYPGQGAIVSSAYDGSHSGHYRDIASTGDAFCSIPWAAGNNPDASIPFTVELWVRPTGDQMNPGPSPINNRVANGITDRTGWVIYQRDPNDSYRTNTGGAVPGESGTGWTFRMYTGTGSGGQDVLTGQPYTMGQWQHLVFTWEPQTDLGPSASGSEQWQGTLTAYANGLAVATNGTAAYAANTNPTEDPANHPPADFAIGSYNLASGLGEEFEGDVDEVAFYNNVVLTTNQILTHYLAGSDPHPAMNYETMVLTAGGDTYFANFGTPIPERTTIPQTYLRFNELAYYPAANSGSLGHLADGSLVMTTNIGTGPDGSGFALPNPAVPVDGLTSWVSLNNPSGLNISGQITLEAWVNPATNLDALARIVSHGPASPTVYDLASFPIELSGSQLISNEVFLRIEAGATTNYVVGSSDGVNPPHSASFQVPAGDLGGGQWIYLAGTYDGTNWNLYRNGASVASTADTVGALSVSGGEWAIGSTGMGWADFFNGQIDEVAIYNAALSPATIAAHYYVAENGPVTISVTKSNRIVTIHWPAGTLQAADNAGGPYVNVTGANAPSYNPPAGPAKKFYRVRL